MEIYAWSLLFHIFLFQIYIIGLQILPNLKLIVEIFLIITFLWNSTWKCYLVQLCFKEILNPGKQKKIFGIRPATATTISRFAY